MLIKRIKIAPLNLKKLEKELIQVLGLGDIIAPMQIGSTKKIALITTGLGNVFYIKRAKKITFHFQENLDPKCIFIEKFGKNNKFIACIYNRVRTFRESSAKVKTCVVKALNKNTLSETCEICGKGSYMENPIPDKHICCVEDLETLDNRVLKETLKWIEKKSKWIQKGYYICPNCMDCFMRCPICNKENHVSYIEDFLASKDPLIIKTRKQYIKLIKNIKAGLNIKGGIPCCTCAERYL